MNLSNLIVSWSNMGVFDIGEKPRARIPFYLMSRTSIGEVKISSFASFPLANVVAYLKTTHHNLKSLIVVIKGHPM